jgi:hypothetical protein
MARGGSSVELVAPTPSETALVRTIKVDDTSYELYAGPCQCCGEIRYRLMRCNGASLSVYEISPADCENLEDYVADLHSVLAVDVKTKLSALTETIAELNSRGLFEAEGMSPFRVGLIDKARLITNRLSKKGLMEEIITKHNDLDHDVASAFILGCIATELHWLKTHEAAVFEGYAHIEGRENGRPLALAARVRQGKKSRSAVRAAAEQLYSQEPSLKHNDAKTAERIARLKLGALRKKDGTFLGTEAILQAHQRAEAPPNDENGDARSSYNSVARQRLGNALRYCDDAIDALLKLTRVRTV